MTFLKVKESEEKIMFCRNCGNQIPDGSANCPNCGNPTNAAPQNTAPNTYGAPQNRAPMNGAAGGGMPVINIAGKQYQLSVKMILPAIMILFLIIGMIGIFSFDTVKVTVKGGGYKETEKFSLSDCTDGDLGFSKFVNVVAILSVIGTVGSIGLCGYSLYQRNTVNAVKAVGLGGTCMTVGYLFVLFNGWYVRAKMKSSGLFALASFAGIKVGGGPSFTSWFWLIVMIAISVCGKKLADQLTGEQAMRNANSGAGMLR